MVTTWMKAIEAVRDSAKFDQRRSGEGLAHLFGDWTNDLWSKARHGGEPRTEENGAVAAPSELWYWNCLGETRVAMAADWVSAMKAHGKGAWGSDYSDQAAVEAIDRLRTEHVILTSDEYHAATYGNAAYSVAERYQAEVKAFFDGRDDEATANSRGRGHVWIANNGGFDSLVVEPTTGGQYTIAVRIPNRRQTRPYEEQPQYVGYVHGPHGLIGSGIEH